MLKYTKTLYMYVDYYRSEAIVIVKVTRSEYSFGHWTEYRRIMNFASQKNEGKQMKTKYKNAKCEEILENAREIDEDNEDIELFTYCKAYKVDYGREDKYYTDINDIEDDDEFEDGFLLETDDLTEFYTSENELEDRCEELFNHFLWLCDAKKERL